MAEKKEVIPTPTNIIDGLHDFYFHVFSHDLSAWGRLGGAIEGPCALKNVGIWRMLYSQCRTRQVLVVGGG